ncbi:MAG: CRISPR system precrRNA processing endoribonuclease RAMP protein Cas6 [Deltaproteobacteria bacterium]|nr:CRISPR system precrRNA processing endoribonuclease RAMP protein Cas6 [Deltaproteobacteria bacterium]
MIDPWRSLLRDVRVLPYRLQLDVDREAVTVPMLRGVWGRALRMLDEGIYDEVFTEHHGGPFYVCRPADTQPQRGAAIEWFLFGPAIARADTLRRAWDTAGGMGYGQAREPFAVRGAVALDPDGREQPSAKPWTMDRATWPLAGKPETTPCRIEFSYPVRLMRQGRLIENPTLADIAVTAIRRFTMLGAKSEGSDLTTRSVAEVARGIAAHPWEGEPLDFVRYSGRQHREVEQRGVAGSLILPEGPGSLWPLLAAAQWTHIGKGCVMGMGRLEIGKL